jgi:thymidylate synthase ThyX
MRMTNFQAPGLDMAIKYIMCEIMESTERLTLAKDILKITNVTFSLEGLTRYQSTLLCELRDSYTQQSQRYVSMNNSSFDELDRLLNNNEELMNIMKDDFERSKG